MRRQVLGAQHPDVAITINNLGILMKDMGDFSESEKYFEEALSLRKEVLGDNHVNTAISKFSYADLFLKSSRPDAALTLLEEALITFSEHLPSDHSFIARTRLRIGSAWLGLGQFEKADAILPASYQSVLSIHHNRSLERALADIEFGKYVTAKGDTTRAREIWKHAGSIFLELEGASGYRYEQITELIRN